MAAFSDPEVAQRARDRLQALTDADLSRFWEVSFEGCPDPDAALVNLERWLGATSSPATNLALLAEAPRLSQALIRVFGASQSLADSIIQNPELSSLFLEPRQLETPISRQTVLAEGRSLLASAYSFTHRLDRLRFLKQRYTLPLVLVDLYGRPAEEAVWTALSDLADALVELTVEVCWNEYRNGKDELPHRCPLMVVAFGKLGGRELNYSSDIDLVYVIPDDTDDATERHLARFSESLTRALSDRMGRGALYRVDLRLRPYGSAGALLRTMHGFETYYDTHAETWEVQALIRSRPILGPDSLVQRWGDTVQRVCFKPKVSDLAVEEMLAMRLRTEQATDDADLKRGAGGIRDVEFLTQVLQIVHGYRHPSVREPATLEALKALDKVHLLDHAVASSLASSYRFLRQLEHRCQLVADQQTHHIPESPKAREHLARLMGLSSWAELSEAVTFHRRSVRSLYESILHPQKEERLDDRGAVASSLGKLAPAALQWFDVLPESEMFYRSLCENEGSMGRVRQVLSEAPTLVARFKKSVPLTELLISGEIEESSDPAGRIRSLPGDAPLDEVAQTFEAAWTTVAASWALDPGYEPGPVLSNLADVLLRHCLRRLYATFDVVALGSHGMEEGSFGSDIDLLFLVRTGQMEAEGQAQHLLLMLDRLKRLGAPIEIDLRLRPMGREGLLVRTYDGLAAYELEAMEMWERFALGQCRLVSGSPQALELVQKAAYALPLTPERVRELVAMKKRIETERVPAQYYRRNVKLGLGGLSDIEWFVHLHEMRFPGATGIEKLRVFDPAPIPDVGGGDEHRMDARIVRLARAGLINAAEREELLEARSHLLAVRNRLALLGYSHDVLPENPDRLDHLGEAMGFRSGNDLLSYHERLIDTVRSIYSDGLERLKA